MKVIQFFTFEIGSLDVKVIWLTKFEAKKSSHVGSFFQKVVEIICK